MKNFFTSLLGSLVALIIFCGGGAFLAVVLLVALAALGQKPPTVVQPGSYLVFDLSANIQDAPQEFDGAALLGPLLGGNRIQTLQLRSVTRALRAAAKDSRIAGLLITGSVQPIGYGAGFGALKEIRAALQTFRASGKPVVAYLNFATTRDYYLISAADDVVLDPFGAILLLGLASQPLFLAGTFEKFGVGVQVTRVGKYKSAVEPFIRKDLSPENREQLQKLLDDIWTDLLGDIATSRRITPADVQRTVDREGLIGAASAVTAKLVDRTAYRDEVIDELKVKTGRKKGTKETFKQIGLAAYAGVAPGTTGTAGGRKNRIAVVYAEGDIVDGDGQIGEVGGRRFARELRQLRQDDDVKAVVLRVNSPGGSATASEEIQRELRLTMAVKPVVASMGSVAASGGYWISTYADRIFAEPTTITGSIGVFGLFINVQQLAHNLGFTWDSVKTGKLAGMLTISRPKTDEELAVFQKLVDWIYDEFTAKVAESRKLDKAKVLEIAQGRVWSGAEAQKLGLVDEVGGLNDAIAYAAEKAGVGANYRLTEYPRKRQLAEIINEIMKGMAPDQAGDDAALKKLLGEIKDQARVLLRFNDPRGIYARLPVEIRIQ
ncbi:MAG: signal peptide peptidase SppA [Opitutaceae bacterium]|nr:signal peptide peptidase SppA [Opitutaceae bacterium]